MKSTICLITTALALMLGLGSCEIDDKEYAVEHSTDREYYLNALKALDWGEGTTYAIGHVVPDADAVCSAMAYAALMKKLGFKCQARMAGEANLSTRYASEKMGFTLPEVMADASDCRLILMDHSEYAQSVPGADKAKILQIIDHHDIGDVRAHFPSYCRFMPYGSACTIVYQSYRELDETIPDDIAVLLLTGILDDTDELTKLTTTRNDSLALAAMMNQLGMQRSDLDSLRRGMGRAERSFAGMNDTQIFNSDMKDYTIGGKKLRIGSLDWYVDEMADFNNRMISVMPSIMAEASLDMIFAKVDRHIPNPDFGKSDAPTRELEHITTGSWILYYGALSKQVAETAFGPSESEGVIWSDIKLSRKTDMVPAITAALE